MQITFDAKPVVKKTTLKLEPGDVIQHGNCVVGYWYTMVMKVERSTYKNERKAKVTDLFEFLAINSTMYGYNASFYVVRDVLVDNQ